MSWLNLLASEGFLGLPDRETIAQSRTPFAWLIFGAGMFLGGFIGAAVGVAVWSPIGVAIAFSAGLLTGVAFMMLARMGA